MNLLASPRSSVISQTPLEEVEYPFRETPSEEVEYLRMVLGRVPKTTGFSGQDYRSLAGQGLVATACNLFIRVYS
jgi:hypothetical protein